MANNKFYELMAENGREETYLRFIRSMNMVQNIIEEETEDEKALKKALEEMDAAEAEFEEAVQEIEVRNEQN